MYRLVNKKYTPEELLAKENRSVLINAYIEFKSTYAYQRLSIDGFIKAAKKRGLAFTEEGHITSLHSWE